MIRPMIPLLAMALVASVPSLASEVVPVPHFDSVQLHGGGSVRVVRGPVERVTILEGSSRFTRIHIERENNLRIDTCNRDCPHQYRLRVEVQSPRVPVLAVDGGGAISVANGFGPVRELTAAVNGGGHIDTRALDAEAVTAAIHGGGEMLVRARSALTGAVSGGGTISYWGDPQVTSVVDGGGSIRPAH